MWIWSRPAERLKENGLEVVEVIAESTARLLVNRAGYQTKRDEVLQLITSWRRLFNADRRLNSPTQLSATSMRCLRRMRVEQSVDKAVQGILQDVRERKDKAVCDYTKRFDEFDLTPELMRVPEEHIREYAAGADDELVEILRKAIKNVREFHENQIEESWEYYAGDGIRLGVRQTPIGSAGVYIPGGKAAYPSSVLMNAIPAQVAGVERIVVVTPPRSLGRKSSCCGGTESSGSS